MRVYGRVLIDPLNPDKGKRWVVVETAPDGSNDMVYVTALCQTLLLNINESPFYGNWGIPAKNSVLQQFAPDIFVTLIGQFYSRFFASLTIGKRNTQTPTYDISILTNAGVKLNYKIPVPV